MLSFPERLLDVELCGSRVVPRFLTSRDHAWVEASLDLALACRGRPRSAVEDRFARPPGLGERWLAWQAMAHLVLGLHGFEVAACLPPARIREVVFGAAARAGAATSATGAAGPRASSPGIVEVDKRTSAAGTTAAVAATGTTAALAAAARELGVSPELLRRDLYADISAARVLSAAGHELRPVEVIDRYNLALVQGLLLRAEQVRVRVEGQLKAVLRYARLQRLICTAELAGDKAAPELAGDGAAPELAGDGAAPELAGDGAARLRVSGPLSIFHHTLKYGHAIAAWLPALARAARWKLEASCLLRGRRLGLEVSHHDPIGSTHSPPRRFDSRLEERFFRDLQRVAPRWEVLREAEVVQLGRRLLTADFTLVDPVRRLRVPIEIVGFWTPEYLADKLAVLRQLPEHRRWVVCLDASLAAGSSERLPDAALFLFRRRIDAGALVRFVEELVLRREPAEPGRAIRAPTAAVQVEMWSADGRVAAPEPHGGGRCRDQPSGPVINPGACRAGELQASTGP